MSKKLQFLFGGIIMLSILLGLSIKKVFKKEDKSNIIEKIENKENISKTTENSSLAT